VRHDTLILGAGMSGLAAGIRLAQAGEPVAILERHSLWGGLNSFYKLGGRRYDTGLHALTNFFRAGRPAGPLARALRALRIPREALELGEQTTSHVTFQIGRERVRLAFGNELELLRSEVARVFPSSVPRFERLLREVPDYGAPRQPAPGARARLLEILGDALLAEMLFCPPCFYGNAREDDMDWDAWGVLFRSIFLEGFARPANGIRTLLDALRGRFLAEGGKLCTNRGVARIVLHGERAVAVMLDDGRELPCEAVLSSAGLLETGRLLGRPANPPTSTAGQISVLETISVLDRPSRELGQTETIGFFNVGKRFRYASPARLGELCDVASGVTCSPDNYAGQRDLPEGRLRISVLADPQGWAALSPEQYAEQKARWSERALSAAAPFAFDPRPYEVARDTFTPSTITRFTGHVNGALYGSPDKRRGGEIGLENVRLIGNDEGYVGIVAALLSGITVANRLLARSTSAAHASSQSEAAT
jgi:phytoene dehydrogenase-like protein